MKRFVQLAPLALVLAACTGPVVYLVPESPTTLDPGPYPAFLGNNLTLLGPADAGLAKGLNIYNSPYVQGPVYGAIVDTGKARFTLNDPQTLSGTTGSIRDYIRTISPLPCGGLERWSGITASDDATFFVPYFYVPYKAPVGGSPNRRAFPALVAGIHAGWIRTGHFVYIDHDTTLTGEVQCDFQSAAAYNLKVDVALKAGWNVLKEQAVAVEVNRVDDVHIVITGGAMDYAIE